MPVFIRLNALCITFSVLVQLCAACSAVDPLAPAKNQPGFPPGVRLAGYFPSWSRSPVSQIPGEYLTHVLYAFAIPGEDNTCSLPNSSGQHIAAFKALKQRYPALKILLSVGGSGTAKAFSKVTQTPASIQVFARACTITMANHGFDGLDLDWEFPTAEQKLALTALVSATRNELDRRGEQDQRSYLLTLAAPAGPWSIKNMELERLAGLLDWFNLMTYNYYGAWSPSTGFNAPLYTVPDDPQQLSLDVTVRLYLNGGVPAAKLLAGIPFYGRAWGGVNGNKDGLFQSYDAQSIDIRPTLDYIDIKTNYLAGALPRYHDTAKVPWLFHPEKKTFISYDDPKSVYEKARYARMGSLGGVMIWHISGDDAQRTLLHAAAEGLGYSPRKQ